MFSGRGGLDLGFRLAGYEVLWANDINADACRTYRENIGKIVEGDVTTIAPPSVKNVDVLAAGFPCQPFSNAGSRKGVNEDRGKLYETVVNFVKNISPKVVLLENVRGILSSKKEGVPVMDVIKSDLEGLGYNVHYQLVNFSDYGVPQNRNRVILLATKAALSVENLMCDKSERMDQTIAATLSGLPDTLDGATEVIKLNPQAVLYGSMIPEGGSWKS